jgi:tetratricopeptide (TPR) repeat protein
MGRDGEGALRSLSSLSKVDGALFKAEARTVYGDALEEATRQRLDRDKSESALLAARALSKFDPKRRGLRSILGQALIAEAGRLNWQGDRDRALALYREACVVVPSSLPAWVGAAEILLQRGQGKEAMQLLAQARQRHPTAGSIRTLTLQALSLR